jgi:hypothetical protein
MLEHGDSILIQPLLSTLIYHSELFSVNDRKNIIYDLVTQLGANSSLRTLHPVGQITKVNNDIVSSFQYDSV